MTAPHGKGPPADVPAEPDGTPRGVPLARLRMPFIDCEGTALECGEILGGIWKTALEAEAARWDRSETWWRSGRWQPLVERHCPHLPDIYRGMARAAAVDERALGAPWRADPPAGCTSFAIAPEATLEGIPLSGQTKDVGTARGRELLVLRMRMTDAPSLLTLTYTGSSWIHGHGFVRGGTAVFRNSLYVTPAEAGLPFMAWGLLALHCPSVAEAVALAERHGIEGAGHVVVADEHGGIAGLEFGRAGLGRLEPRGGIYAHANAVEGPDRLRDTETDDRHFHRTESLHRSGRLAALLAADRGRLTAALAHAALTDHDGHPVGICRHQNSLTCTGAAVVAEPTRGLLHVTRGPPCRNWPKTYSVT
jgi:hypothetical protein